MTNQKEIREHVGLCYYCEKNEVDYFCAECWFGICDECAEGEPFDGELCLGECLEVVPNMLVVDYFDKHEKQIKRNT